MSSLFLNSLLNNVQQFGYPALWATVFIAAVGTPLPIVLVLLAAGAFAALGDFNIVALAAITISASVSGDSVGYLIGRLWGTKALNWVEHSAIGKRFLKPDSIARSRQYFNKRGGWAVFFSRFLVAGLGGIVNLLAGTELFPYRNFLFFDIGGEILGALIPLSFGFVFGASWEAVGDIFGELSLLILGALVVTYLFILLLRYMRGLRVSKAVRNSGVQDAVSIIQSASTIDPPAQSSGHLPMP